MTAAPTAGAVRIAGDTHVGKVRTNNEDSLIVDPERGLFVVLDGMGGANAGDVASQTARDAIHSFVAARRGSLEPRALIEAAIQSGTAAVFGASQASPERHGMGTTVVACLLVDTTRLVVAHVGDSRAYLLRQGRLQALTRDHTIVEELVDRGMLSPDEAERHPYKNVLSRNLGARPDARVDVVDVDLKPGDRVMLCSDGLYGYASADGIQYVLGSGDAPEHVARDLIELALRGGGGDNVTAIVIELPAVIASTTAMVRSSGAIAWWQRRQRFLQFARDKGLTRNPIVRGLDPAEALELVGLNLCQAIFHDLEKSTGVNVWTFAQNLAGGWFEQGGDWAPLRAMMDILGGSARAVVDELRGLEPELGFLVDVAVSRALVVAELALGGLLAERLRHVDEALIQLHTAAQAAAEARAQTLEPVDDTADRFIDNPTIPFLRPDRPVTSTGETAEVRAAIEHVVTIAHTRTPPRAELAHQALSALEAVATDDVASFSAAVHAARDFYGIRSVDEAGVMPLFDALEQARLVVTTSVQQLSASAAVRTRVLRVLSSAHQRLVGAVTGLVLEAAAPYADRLREAQAVTAQLRDRVAQVERKRAGLERRLATNADVSLPWGSRGTTEW